MNDMGKYVLIWLCIANAAGLILMGIDKLKARKQKWRIPEATLFIAALIGGSVGSLAGMYLFRHKTKKWYFVIGMPLILAAQIALAILILK